MARPAGRFRPLSRRSASRSWYVPQRDFSRARSRSETLRAWVIASIPPVILLLPYLTSTWASLRAAVSAHIKSPPRSVWRHGRGLPGDRHESRAKGAIEVLPDTVAARAACTISMRSEDAGLAQPSQRRDHLWPGTGQRAQARWSWSWSRASLLRTGSLKVSFQRTRRADREADR